MGPLPPSVTPPGGEREERAAGSPLPLSTGPPPPPPPQATEATPLLPVKAPPGDGGYVSHGVGGSSIASAVFNLATTSIGAGIMALPATIKVLGLPLGLAFIALMGALTDLSIAVLLRCSAACGAASYGDLMAAALRRPGRRLIEGFTIVHTLGSLIVYLIIMGDVLSGTSGKGVGGGGRHTGVLEELAGGAAVWNSREPVLFVVTFCILLPLTLLRRIDSLMFTSALSVALAVLFVLFTLAAAAVRAARGQLAAPRLLPVGGSWPATLELFTVIPVMTNAFICHYNVHPILQELENPTEARLRQVSRASQALCTAVYLATAAFGYLLFGDATSSDVLANFDADLGLSKPLDDLVRVGYVVHLMLVFPIVFFPLRQALDDALFYGAAPPLAAAPRRFHALTLSAVACIFLLSILIPDIYLIFSFLGAAVAVSVGFTFPALISLRTEPTRSMGFERWEVWIMLVLGVVVTITGVGSNVYDLAKSFVPSSP